MRFDRCAGGHNFDFDTDVCTRCGIDRRRYRDGGNPECVPRNVQGADARQRAGNANSWRSAQPAPPFIDIRIEYTAK